MQNLWAKVERSCPEARKVGKNGRRLVKAWQENGLAAFAETPRADKGQTRKSEYWYNLTVKTYKAGNRGSDRMTRTQVAEKIAIRAYELAKDELKQEISKLETQGFRGEELDWKVGTLIKNKATIEGFKGSRRQGFQPPFRLGEG